MIYEHPDGRTIEIIIGGAYVTRMDVTNSMIYGTEHGNGQKVIVPAGAVVFIRTTRNAADYSRFTPDDWRWQPVSATIGLYNWSINPFMLMPECEERGLDSKVRCVGFVVLGERNLNDLRES